MGKCHKLNGMGVEGSPVRGTLGKQIVVHAQVGRKLGGRHHKIVGHDFVMCAVVGDADDAAVCHRVTGKVAHPLLGTLAIEPAAFQMGQFHPDRESLRDCREFTHSVIHILGDVHGDISAVALGPTFGPKVAGCFCNLPYGGFEGRSGIKNRHIFNTTTLTIPAGKN